MTSPHQQSFLFKRSDAEPPRRRNVVIDAGAGTGKTTAIVAEVLKLLLGNEDLAPERIVLVTFTEKAAGEIADRVHDALEAVERGECPPQYRDSISGIRDPSGVARKQLDRIDGLRAQTIHSFCQSILRMFPIEAGLDPQFRIIEGFERSLLYSQLYDKWADDETRVANDPLLLRDWESLLAHLGYLFRIREVIFSLVSRRDLLDENYDLGSIDEIASDIEAAVAVLQSSGADMHIVDYVQRNPLPPPSLDSWIAYFAPIARDIRGTKLPTGKAMVEVKNALKVLRSGDKGESIYDALVSHRAAVALVALTRRFLAFLDAEKRALGVADFDDLLLRTAALLENAHIAERVRQQFDFIFVDEFQDTDRVQARIIERLATDRFGAWTDGRILIVGDPKQSIYGFRRADPETYQRFSDQMHAAGAEHRRLDKQWRSHPDLLHALNAMFPRVFKDTGFDPNVFRPAYHPLECGGHAPSPVPSERVTFLYAPIEPARERQESEAESIAEWIRARGGDLRKYAVLLRRLTKLDHYLDTFDRYGIDYVLPPTRAFLDRRAPVELVAVLRAIAHPFDRGAQVSAARSPYFALTDEEIAEGILASTPAWETFNARMDQYRDAAQHLDVSGVIDLIIESCGIEAIYAASVEGRRSLRHLEHLRAIAFTFDQKRGGSIRQFVGEVDRRRSEPDEMEPSLADDDSNAVRILSVHAAKGLEFDTVILPDLSFPRGNNEGVTIFAVDDPRSLVLTGVVESLSAEFRYTAGAQKLKKVAGAREEAELRRLFYVAVTRAKEEVVFVANPAARKSGFLATAAEVFGLDESMWPAEPGRNVTTIDGIPVAFEKVATGAGAWTQRRLIDQSLEHQLATGDVVPLEIHEVRATPIERAQPFIDMAPGILLHRVLELWDGESDVEPLLAFAASEIAADDRATATVRRRLASLRRSPAFDRIVRGTTIAREMTIRFVDDTGALVEKRIDRLLRENGTELIVDYKSGARDRERLARDREQVAQYCRAIERMTGRSCAGLLWYIDADRDEIVDVDRAKLTTEVSP